MRRSPRDPTTSAGGGAGPKAHGPRGGATTGRADRRYPTWPAGRVAGHRAGRSIRSDGPRGRSWHEGSGVGACARWHSSFEQLYEVPRPRAAPSDAAARIRDGGHRLFENESALGADVPQRSLEIIDLVAHVIEAVFRLEKRPHRRVLGGWLHQLDQSSILPAVGQKQHSHFLYRVVNDVGYRRETERQLPFLRIQ